MNRLLELAYRYRNRVLEQALSRHDMRRAWDTDGTGPVQPGQAAVPVLTVQVPYLGLRGFFRYRRGKASLQRRGAFPGQVPSCTADFTGRPAADPVVISISSLLSFAKDIDTQAELDELDIAGP